MTSAGVADAAESDRTVNNSLKINKHCPNEMYTSSFTTSLAAIRGRFASLLGLAALVGLATMLAAAVAVTGSLADEYGVWYHFLPLLILYVSAFVATAYGLISISTRPLVQGLVILGAAALLRFVAFIWLFSGYPPQSGDPVVYVTMAKHLVGQGELAFYDSGLKQVFKAQYPPLYIAILGLLSGVTSLGQGVVFGLNLTIDLVTILAVLLVARRLGGQRAGCVGALLLAVWPSAILNCSYPQKEGLGALFAFCALVFLTITPTKLLSTWRSALMLGVSWGALALTQPSLALLPVVMAPFGLLRHRWGLWVKFLIRSALTATLILTPWWVRNYTELNAFVPLTTVSGWTFWVGNNPQATGRWMPAPIEFHGLSELELSRVAAATARTWIQENPVDFIRVTAYKAAHAFGGDTFPSVRLRIDVPDASRYLSLIKALLQGFYVLLLTHSAFVAWRLRSCHSAEAGRSAAAVMFVAGVAYLILFNVWFEFHERHTYVLRPLICIFTGVFAIAWLNQPSPPLNQPKRSNFSTRF